MGLRDTSLAERMQLDRDLTLEKALNMARQSEMIKRQQTDLRGEAKGEIDAVMAKHKKQKQPTPKTSLQHKHLATKSKAPTDRQKCYRCGKAPAHGKWQCPAKGVTCHTHVGKRDITVKCVSQPKLYMYWKLVQFVVIHLCF